MEVYRQEEKSRLGFTVRFEKYNGFFKTKWETFHTCYDIYVNDMLLLSTYNESDAENCFETLLDL